MRSLHRWIMTLSVIFMLYLAVTGLLMQGVDFLALWRPQLPASVPNIRSIKEFSAGPPYFSILSNVDENGAAIDDAGALQRLSTAFTNVRQRAPDAAITSIELRIVAGVRQAVVTAGNEEATARTYTVDADSGAILDDQPAVGPAAPQSTHDAIKDWHRGNIVGLTGVWLNMWSAIALFVMCFTGVWLYLQLWLRRRQLGRNSIFWS